MLGELTLLVVERASQGVLKTGLGYENTPLACRNLARILRVRNGTAEPTLLPKHKRLLAAKPPSLPSTAGSNSKPHLYPELLFHAAFPMISTAPGAIRRRKWPKTCENSISTEVLGKDEGVSHPLMAQPLERAARLSGPGPSKGHLPRG